MKQYELYIFDLDGTVYLGNDPAPHAPDVIAQLVERGSLVRYLTNSSAVEPEAVCEKLAEMGIPCRPEWVFTSGLLAARVCRERGYRTVHVVGEAPLTQAIEAAGLTVVEDGKADVVLVGLCRHIDYEILDRALQCLLAGAVLLATNRDITYPVEGGAVRPGAGSIVAAVETSAGVTAEVLGKPSGRMVEQILKACDCQKENALVVGDRVETDIASGRAAGCDTWLVLSGVTNETVGGTGCSADLRGLLD
ncbi:MAG: HAD-IIA family hydrolase [Armatimonadetes bacterium]|nr:HAD-IIA family hydrolase [Armatimonadota bacterium]